MSCGHKWNFETVPCGYCNWERLFGKKTIKIKEVSMSTVTVRVEFYPQDYSLINILNKAEDIESFSLNMSFKTVPRENEFIMMPSNVAPYKIGRVFAVIHEYYGDVRVLVSGPF